MGPLWWFLFAYASSVAFAWPGTEGQRDLRLLEPYLYRDLKTQVRLLRMGCYLLLIEYTSTQGVEDTTPRLTTTKQLPVLGKTC